VGLVGNIRGHTAGKGFELAFAKMVQAGFGQQAAAGVIGCTKNNVGNRLMHAPNLATGSA
jgi:hypothetical protein